VLLLSLACAGRAVGVWSVDFLAEETAAVFVLLGLMSMDHWPEQRLGFEVTKDCNGGDQVTIRSPRGASVRVSCFSSGYFAVSVGRSTRHFSVSCGALSDSCSGLMLLCVAGEPARGEGRLVEEQPWRGAPLYQQQGEALAYPSRSVFIFVAMFLLCYVVGGGFGSVRVA
jgi:hypothetical protein